MAEYIPPGAEESAQLAAAADAKFAEALAHSQRGDNYTLLTVVFALVLFLAAVSQRVRVSRARLALVGLAVLVGVVGAIIMLTFPIKI